MSSSATVGSTEPGEGSRPLRRDAVRNRELIVTAAEELLAERGLQVGLNEVARRAGVGVGTVYRRFPTMELLVDELVARRSDEVVAIAERAAAHTDSWAGLVDFVESMNTFVADNRGVREAMLRAGDAGASLTRARARMAPAVEELLERAKADGHVRPDVGRADLVMVDVMVEAVRTYFVEDGPDQWRRALGLALDGLRARREGPTPLDVGPLPPEALDHAMRTAHTRP